MIGPTSSKTKMFNSATNYGGLFMIYYKMQLNTTTEIQKSYLNTKKLIAKIPLSLIFLDKMSIEIDPYSCFLIQNNSPL